MRRLLHRTMAACAAMVCSISVAAAASGDNSGAVPQQGGPGSQHVSAPPLNLTDEQRQKIQQSVAGQHAQVSFQLKTAKPAQSFQPTVHAKLPKQLKPHPFPQSLFETL